MNSIKALVTKLSMKVKGGELLGSETGAGLCIFMGISWSAHRTSFFFSTLQGLLPSFIFLAISEYLFFLLHCSFLPFFEGTQYSLFRTWVWGIT